MASAQDDAATGIALRAQEHKLLFFGLNLAVPAMLHPDVPLLHWTLQLTDAASDDVPIILGGQTGEEEKLFLLGARGLDEGDRAPG